MTDIAAIAAGLTKAQRDCLLYWNKGYFHRLTMRSLYQRGLVKKGEYTPLGLQVRAWLRENG